jgi:hypothetical protein
VIGEGKHADAWRARLIAIAALVLVLIVVLVLLAAK